MDSMPNVLEPNLAIAGDPAARPPQTTSSGDLRQLAAALAHEVRNPLNSMAIHADLMESRLRAPAGETEALLRSVSVIQGEIARIDRVIEEYLAHAGPIEGPRRPVDPMALAAEAVERVRAVASARGVRVEVRAAGPLRAPWTLDVEAFAAALDAILSNAAAAARDSLVEILLSSDEEHAEVSVHDAGSGIAAEDLPHVFRMGFSRWGRQGLGLTVAKQIVKGHGGSIAVESGGQGPGTRVRIRVPLDLDP
jgi:signal transduction histidine kinase